MRIANCPNCGGAELYMTAATTPANGMFGPNLLPKVPLGHFEVVVCKDCGLTRFFARRVDVQALGANWVKVAEPDRPLGLSSK
jgi:predicted nucleic-acid-binding Zn-ribbon protein